jgi:hypothetical protein
MNEEETGNVHTEKNKRHTFQVRLPGFINDSDVGLGDVIKYATSAVGVSPCGSCTHRASLLNNLLVFTGKRSRR